MDELASLLKGSSVSSEDVVVDAAAKEGLLLNGYGHSV